MWVRADSLKGGIILSISILNGSHQSCHVQRLGRRYLLLTVLFLKSLSGAVAADPNFCGDPFSNHFGPFDYRTATAKQRRAVESVHYTAEIQRMLSGNTTSVGGDLAYTLRVFPNHHGALKTMADWSIRSKSNPAAGARYTVECWFDRGLRFRPDDSMVKMLFGIYQLQIGKAGEAVAQLEAARKGEVGPPDANLHYNLGLAYLKLGRFSEALENAHLAYGLGFPLPGLKNQLVRAGKWREPTRQPVGAAIEESEANKTDATKPVE